MDLFGSALGTLDGTQLDTLAKKVWTDYAAGRITEDTAGGLADQIEVVRKERQSRKGLATGPAHGRRSVFSTGKTQPRSPDRRRSLERRRMLAASGPMPPAFAINFTVGEAASLCVVAMEVAEMGTCAITLGEIATRAGVSIDTARRGIKKASSEGLLTVQERRRHLAPSLPNLITITSAEWLAWIEHRPKALAVREGGRRSMPQTLISKTEMKSAHRSPEMPAERRQRSQGGYDPLRPRSIPPAKSRRM